MSNQYDYYPGTPYKEIYTDHIVRIVCLSMQDAWKKTQYILKEFVTYETITGLFITCTREDFEDTLATELSIDANCEITPELQPRYTQITEEEFMRLWEESKC